MTAVTFIVGKMKPGHCRFFLERFSSVICVIALQQLLVTHWRRREERLRRNTSPRDGGGMRATDNAAKQRIVEGKRGGVGVGGRVLLPAAGSVFRCYVLSPCASQVTSFCPTAPSKSSFLKVPPSRQPQLLWGRVGGLGLSDSACANVRRFLVTGTIPALKAER